RFPPRAGPQRRLPPWESAEVGDPNVVSRLEGRDRRAPPVRRGGHAVDEHDRGIEAHLKRSRSAGMTKSFAFPSPRRDSPRTMAAGILAVLPMTSSAAPAISSATAIIVVRSSYPIESPTP